MSGVNIEYKGESIATIPDTGSKTIKTQGKYCEGDILVEYEAPPTPTPTLQSKTVTPTTAQQSVTPDSGYDGLSDVTVNATPLEVKTVTPTSQQQVITPTAPNIGLSSVTVGAAPQPTLITKQITANGTYTAAQDGADGYSEVTVDVPVPAPVEEKYINFIDYDGTVLYSWTEEELQEATELPPLPTREGYTYQEWNWDLADLKRYDMSLYVGAIMKPANGETQIHIQTFEGDPLSTQLNVEIKQGVISIDWGDGTPNDSAENNRNSYSLKSISHTYETMGKYIIKVSFTGEGAYAFENACTLTAPYLYRITEVNIGDFCEKLGYASFTNAAALRRISISKECLDIGGGYAFQGVSANYIVLPKKIKTINRLLNASKIRVVSLPLITDFISTATNYAFYQSSITFIRLLGLTTINLNMFASCGSLYSIIIPSTVTSIGSNAFAYCPALTIIDLSQYDDVNSMPALSDTNAFNGIASNAVFYVRNQEMLDTFSAATNWSTYAAQFVIGGKFAEVTT